MLLKVDFNMKRVRSLYKPIYLIERTILLSLSTVTVLLLLLPVVALTSTYLPGDIMDPWAGGPGYYSSWSNGPPNTPDFFPIAAWLQSPESTTNAQKYREIGINLHIGLWQGPTANQLSALAACSHELRNVNEVPKAVVT